MVPKPPSGVPRFVDAIVVLAIVWLRLPAAFGIAPPTSIRILALIPLLVGVVVLLPLKRPVGKTSMLGVLVALFVLIVIVSIFRGESAGAYETFHQVIYDAVGICLLAGLGYLYFATALNVAERERRLFILCCAPGAYVAINVALHLGGIKVATSAGEPTTVLNAGTPAELLGLFGIHSTRVLFPFADGVNNFGDIAGVALVTSTILALRTTGPARRYPIVLLLAALYGLFATDARGALLSSLGATALILVLGRRRVVAGIAIFVPFTTAIVRFVLGIVASTSLVGTFSREGDNLLTASNRTVIWNAVDNFLTSSSPSQLYGYGANGQISSGASLGYEHLFAAAAHPSQYTAHNFMLQTVLDTGYIGLLVFVLLLYLAARRLQRVVALHDSIGSRALLGVLIFVVFAGATDSTPMIYTPETLYFFLLIVTCAAAVRVASERRRPRSRQAANQYIRATTRPPKTYQKI
jgi:O-antigen ligase